MKPSEYTFNSQIVGVAYENWYRILGNNGHRRFWEFIRPDNGYDQVHFYKFTPDEMDKLKLLTGPYHVAIIKAWLIKQDKSNANDKRSV